MKLLDKLRRKKEPDRSRWVGLNRVVTVEEVEDNVENRYLRILADPIHSTMDYTEACPFSREECQRIDLLVALREEYRETMPRLAKAGKPGPDVRQFKEFSPFCQACILAQEPRGMLRRR